MPQPSSTLVTDLVFLLVPAFATAIGIWSKGTLSGEQIVGAWTLSLGYAAGRPAGTATTVPVAPRRAAITDGGSDIVPSAGGAA